MISEMMDFGELVKNLKKNTAGYKIIKIAILADTASQLVVKAIRGMGIGDNINYEIFESEYNQINSQVFDSASALYKFKPDFILILRSSEKLLRQFYHQSNADKALFSEQQVAFTGKIFKQIRAVLNSKIIINTFPETDDSVFGNFSGKTHFSFPYQVKRLNVGLMNLSQENNDLFLLQLDSLMNRIGLAAGFDPKMYVNADMAYSLDLLPYMAKHVHNIIQAVGGSSKKCLILDLDNTTWGGVIGDDGLEGIQIGDLGIGKAFTDLQCWALELKKRGIILAVCSKNTESIAKEPFERHPDMQLHLADIAIFVANWENKVDNIRHIQRVLNISFESMVFLDDNPFEREMVKSAIPELTTPSLPEDPAEYLPYLRSLNLFETASITTADENRTAQYQQEEKRQAYQKTFSKEDDYLDSLAMRGDVKPFDPFDCPRVAQLSQRSNQFNLRTVRYTEEDIRRISKSSQHLTLSINLSDIYGDYGLISAIILQKIDPDTLSIDTWIMSCRVLNRGVEIFVLNAIVELANRNGFRKLQGEFIPTKKNDLVKDHYRNLGFSEISPNRFQLDIPNYQPSAKIKINQPHQHGTEANIFGAPACL